MSIMHARWGKLYRGTTHEMLMEKIICSLGCPYRTQFPGFLYGFPYFPDFYLPTYRLVVEVDDPSHRLSSRVSGDQERDNFMRMMGVRTLRYTHQQIEEDPIGIRIDLLGKMEEQGAGEMYFPQRHFTARAKSYTGSKVKKTVIANPKGKKKC